MATFFDREERCAGGVDVGGGRKAASGDRLLLGTCAEAWLAIQPGGWGGRTAKNQVRGGCCGRECLGCYDHAFIARGGPCDGPAWQALNGLARVS